MRSHLPLPTREMAALNESFIIFRQKTPTQLAWVVGGSQLFRGAPVMVNAGGYNQVTLTSPDGVFTVNKIISKGTKEFLIQITDDVNGRWFSMDMDIRVLDDLLFEPPYILPPQTKITIELQCANGFNSQNISPIFSGVLIS